MRKTGRLTGSVLASPHISRRWLQESSRPMRSSWPTWEFKIWTSAWSLLTLSTTRSSGSGNCWGETALVYFYLFYSSCGVLKQRCVEWNPPVVSAERCCTWTASVMSPCTSLSHLSTRQTCTMLSIQTLLQPFSCMFLVCGTTVYFYKMKHVWVSTPQPQAQWQFLHPRPRERRERLQHRSGKTQRRHRTMYTSTSWSVLNITNTAALQQAVWFMCVFQLTLATVVKPEHSEFFFGSECTLFLQERTKMRSWMRWRMKHGGSTETVSCWETACRASAGTVSVAAAQILCILLFY